MKKILVPSLMALALGSVSGLAQAQTATPESSLSFNVGVTSDYRYRGISQSRLQPALQGGVDYADKSGFYVGAWGSTIKFIKDSGASKGNVELDLYGGYKGTVGAVAYDVGFLRYEYVGNTYKDIGGTAVNANTDELYGAATYGPFTLKYSHAISNIFGYGDSKGSTYWDLSATFDLGEGYTLVPHIGRQNYKKNEFYSYTDVAITLNKDLGNGLSASLAAISTNGKETTFKPLSDTGYNAAKSTLVVGLKYTF